MEKYWIDSLLLQFLMLLWFITFYNYFNSKIPQFHMLLPHILCSVWFFFFNFPFFFFNFNFIPNHDLSSFWLTWRNWWKRGTRKKRGIEGKITEPEKCSKIGISNKFNHQEPLQSMFQTETSSFLREIANSEHLK